MRKQQIEYWVLSKFDDAGKLTANEDHLVEYKRELIDPSAAARRIAGQANAVGGDSFLWIVGVDEVQKRVVGGEFGKIADWVTQVFSNFDHVHPHLTDLVVPIGDSHVLALVFSSDRAPYVVKTGESKVQWEVPYRVGTALRTATREHLVRILGAVSFAPNVEILSALLQILRRGDDGWQILATLEFYFQNPPLPSPVVFPLHKCSVQIEFPFEHQSFSDLTKLARNRADQGAFVSANDSQVVVKGPGSFDLTCFQNFGTPDLVPRYSDPVNFHLVWQPVNGPTPLQIDLVFEETDIQDGFFSNSMTLMRYKARPIA